MKKHSLSLLLAAVMALGSLPVFTTARATDEQTTETVVIDYNCSSFPSSVVTRRSNNPPHYYFEASAADGTVHAGSDGEVQGYSRLIFPFTATASSFSLEMDMKVNNLANVGSYVWSGMCFEVNIPGGGMVYLSLQEMGQPDENGKNAKVIMMTSSRSSGTTSSQRIAIPTDGQFHEWQILFNGESEVRLSIDGEVQATFTNITAASTATNASLMISNSTNRVASGVNDVYFDHIKLTTGVTVKDAKVVNAFAERGASAEALTVHTEISELYAGDDITVRVTSNLNPTDTVVQTYEPENTVSTLTLTNIPFTGPCTVEVNLPESPKYTFKTYLYSEFEFLTGETVLQNVPDEVTEPNDGEETEEPTEEEPFPNKAYVYNNMAAIELPEGSPWEAAEYEAFDGTTAACLRYENVSGTHSFTVPVTLSGKFAVYIGYAQGTSSVLVNGETVSITGDASTSAIREVFALTDNFENERITIANNGNASAQIAYVKFVSISDEQYEISNAQDNSQNLMMDHDGFSMFTGTTNNTPAFLINKVFTEYEYLNLGKYNYAAWVTGMLNYPSTVQRSYIEDRLEELNIPTSQWPTDFLDLIDINGNHIDPATAYPDTFRDRDANALSNIRTLNEYGIPQEIIAAHAAENNLGEVYASLRMSAYYDGGATGSYMNGTFYNLHPEWIRGGSYQLSYYYAGYRNYIHDLLIEMASFEDVAGVTMDFARYPYIFGTELENVTERTRIMNEFVASVREDMPEGKLLNVRIPTPDETLALQNGLDYKHWVREGLVDCVIVSGVGHELFFDVTPYTEFFEDYPEVELYIGITSSLSGHDITKEEEDIIAGGGTIEGKTHLSFEQYMLRAYNAYAAGADGIFLFNGITGTSPAYANMNNKASMQKWYEFEYPASMFEESVTFTTDNGTIVLDFDCSSTDASSVTIQSNNYPAYYFADSNDQADVTVQPGTIFMGGDGSTQQYCTMVLPFTEDLDAYSLEISMRIDSLMKPINNSVWRGFIIEIHVPGKNNLYFAIHPGTTSSQATVAMMTTERSSTNVVRQTVNLPTDGGFHTWEFHFDGESTATLLIDGVLQGTFPGITLLTSQTSGLIQVRNSMMSIESGEPAVYFDRITLISTND